MDLGWVPKKVPLTRGLSRSFDGKDPIDATPMKGMAYSARKSCVEKRMSMWDEFVGDQRVAQGCS
jgi:hypothetical protein